MSWHCGKTRKRPKNGSKIEGPHHCRNRRFDTHFDKKNVVLRAQFPVRRDVYVYIYI